MKINIKTLTFCGSIAAIVAFSGTAQAQITFANSGGTLTSWAGAPVYVSLANSALSGATTGQGSATISGTYGLLAETFTPSSSFTLGSFNALVSVNNISSPAYTIRLLDLGVAGTVSVSASGATYGPTTAVPGTVLFSDTLTFSAASGGEVQGAFTLSLADQVALSSGEEYALELWIPTGDGAAGTTWFRGSTADPGGQMFSGADAAAGARLTLAGNGQAGGAPRTGALALYAAAPVPEPASMALLGLGALVGTFAIRRKQP